jgi:hypothetical protein
MSVLLAILLAGALLVAAAVAHEKRHQRGFDEWRLAAQELGLSLSGDEDSRSITGVLNGVPVRADFRRRQLRESANGTPLYAGSEERTSFFAGQLPRSERSEGTAGGNPGTASSAIPETLVVHADTLGRSWE